jgi:hypothetical protein
MRPFAYPYYAMEPWVAATFHLPMTGPMETVAAVRACDDLLSRFSSGFTSEEDLTQLPAGMRNAWSEEQQTYLRRREFLFTVQLPGTLDDEGLRARLRDTRSRLSKMYADCRAPQLDGIRCTVQQIHQL